MSSPEHYLTRLRYPLSNRELARGLRNPYEQHRTLWQLFAEPGQGKSQGNATHSADRQFLFRQNRDPALARRGMGEFILISNRPALADTRFVMQAKAYRPQLKTGDSLHFLLRAEVLASIAQKVDGVRGKRHDPMLSALKSAAPEARGALRKLWLHGESDQEANISQPALLISDWLAPKLARLGFALDLQSSRAERHETVQLKRDGKGKEICFSEADFQGQLRVTDPAPATLAALGGIGHSKAFGCGLLLLRRVQLDTPDD
jgi:CRISPR system Cascade subunit CasE